MARTFFVETSVNEICARGQSVPYKESTFHMYFTPPDFHTSEVIYWKVLCAIWGTLKILHEESLCYY